MEAYHGALVNILTQGQVVYYQPMKDDETNWVRATFLRLIDTTTRSGKPVQKFLIEYTSSSGQSMIQKEVRARSLRITPPNPPDVGPSLKATGSSDDEDTAAAEYSRQAQEGASDGDGQGSAGGGGAAARRPRRSSAKYPKGFTMEAANSFKALAAHKLRQQYQIAFAWALLRPFNRYDDTKAYLADTPEVQSGTVWLCFIHSDVSTKTRQPVLIYVPNKNLQKLRDAIGTDDSKSIRKLSTELASVYIGTFVNEKAIVKHMFHDIRQVSRLRIGISEMEVIFEKVDTPGALRTPDKQPIPAQEEVPRTPAQEREQDPAQEPYTPKKVQDIIRDLVRALPVKSPAAPAGAAEAKPKAALDAAEPPPVIPNQAVWEPVYTITVGNQEFQKFEDNWNTWWLNEVNLEDVIISCGSNGTWAAAEFTRFVNAGDTLELALEQAAAGSKVISKDDIPAFKREMTEAYERDAFKPNSTNPVLARGVRDLANQLLSKGLCIYIIDQDTVNPQKVLPSNVLVYYSSKAITTINQETNVTRDAANFLVSLLSYMHQPVIELDKDPHKEAAVGEAAVADTHDIFDAIDAHSNDPTLHNLSELRNALSAGNLDGTKEIQMLPYSDEVAVTPLAYAAWKGFSEAVQMIIDAGANVNTRFSDIDGDRSVALFIAYEYGHVHAYYHIVARADVDSIKTMLTYVEQDGIFSKLTRAALMPDMGMRLRELARIVNSEWHEFEITRYGRMYQREVDRIDTVYYRIGDSPQVIFPIDEGGT